MWAHGTLTAAAAELGISTDALRHLRVDFGWLKPSSR